MLGAPGLSCQAPEQDVPWPELVCTAKPVTEPHLAALEKFIDRCHDHSNPGGIGRVVLCHRLCQ